MLFSRPFARVSSLSIMSNVAEDDSTATGQHQLIVVVAEHTRNRPSRGSNE